MTIPRVTRFDHAVIAVKDLDAAIETYRNLGFAVSPGGRHTGRGTHNAIVRFGLDYLELIAVHDERLARSAGGNVMDLLDYLERSDGGPLGFALAAAELDEIARSWSSDLAPAGIPVSMERVRPDGVRLEWRLLIPGGSAWRKPWPFLIEWGTPDSERLQRDSPGAHHNGALGVAGVTVLHAKASRVVDLYTRDLGLAIDRRSDSSDWMALKLGRTTIELGTPSTATQQTVLEREGPGLFEVLLSVSDLAATARSVGVEPDGEGRIVLPPDRACGATLAFVERG